eukprot:TRINITY_DN14406_c0_g1_i5.p1 TRINITY_DN14406_c0_g1~~TRINITY_DN14406_c0_g1_i5.p1  ORF type:complete len:101 (-),score=17.06 TRINITY_DN14406_c0_g1_i5:51-353(-)
MVTTMFRLAFDGYQKENSSGMHYNLRLPYYSSPNFFSVSLVPQHRRGLFSRCTRWVEDGHTGWYASLKIKQTSAQTLYLLYGGGVPNQCTLGDSKKRKKW